MEVFRRHYNTYYRMLRITGLWPFDHSALVQIQRTIFALIILSCITVQCATLASSELSTRNILVTLSFGSLITLFLVRYIGFIFSIPSVKFIYTSVQTEYNRLKNPIEVEILTTHLSASRRVILIYLLVEIYLCLSMFAFVSFPLVLNKTILQKESLPHVLKFFGFHPNPDKYIYLIFILATFSISFGIFVIACTESTLALCAYYACGLFKITSYRICNAIELSTKPTVSKNNANYHAGIREAMDLHTKTIKIILVSIAGHTISYLGAILVAIVSFAVNLYRFILATTETNDIQELVISTSVVFGHLFFIYMNNFSGQKVIDESMQVFHQICNSMWYCAPISLQKVLLIILHRSSIQCSYNLAGLFVPCYEGFSMMMSTSFSYFSILYSTL